MLVARFKILTEASVNIVSNFNVANTRYITKYLSDITNTHYITADRWHGVDGISSNGLKYHFLRTH